MVASFVDRDKLRVMDGKIPTEERASVKREWIYSPKNERKGVHWPTKSKKESHLARRLPWKSQALWFEKGVSCGVFCKRIYTILSHYKLKLQYRFTLEKIVTEGCCLYHKLCTLTHLTQAKTLWYEVNSKSYAWDETNISNFATMILSLQVSMETTFTATETIGEKRRLRKLGNRHHRPHRRMV